jgi:hypothetical protein
VQARLLCRTLFVKYLLTGPVLRFSQLWAANASLLPPLNPPGGLGLGLLGGPKDFPGLGDSLLDVGKAAYITQTTVGPAVKVAQLSKKSSDVVAKAGATAVAAGVKEFADGMANVVKTVASTGANVAKAVDAGMSNVAKAAAAGAATTATAAKAAMEDAVLTAKTATSQAKKTIVNKAVNAIDWNAGLIEDKAFKIGGKCSGEWHSFKCSPFSELIAPSHLLDHTRIGLMRQRSSDKHTGSKVIHEFHYYSSLDTD